VDVLEWLLQHGQTVYCHSAEFAAKHGHINVLSWLWTNHRYVCVFDE
jgi:hypothetical protein